MRKWYHEISVSEYLTVMRLDPQGLLEKENRPQIRSQANRRGYRASSEVVKLINCRFSLSLARVLTSQGVISGNTLVRFYKQTRWAAEDGTGARAAFLESQAIGQWRRSHGRKDARRSFEYVVVC